MVNILEGIYEQLRKEQRKKEYFYVTDIGKCKRKIIMDFEGLPKKPLTDSELLMFDDANVSHSNLSTRMRIIKGIAVIGEEMDINDGLPEMWHGRLDLLYFDIKDREFTVVDFKGTRSFKGSVEFPKQNHVYQIQAYIYALIKLGIPVEKGILFYKDRTGSNTPILCEVMPNPEMEAIFKEYEDMYELYKTSKILPEILPRILKQKKDEIFLVPDWQCDYCNYAGVSCNPVLSQNKVAGIKEGILEIRKDYLDMTDKITNFYNCNGGDLL